MNPVTGLPRPMRIDRVRRDNAQTATFFLDGVMDAQPGQFVMAWLPGMDEKPFSLAGAQPVSLTIAAVGPFTETLHRLGVGDQLWLRGPLGRPFEAPSSPSHCLLVGGGYGVAPLSFLAGHLLDAGQRVSMIVGARTAGQLLTPYDLAARGVHIWQTTEDGSAGIRGLVTDALGQALGEAVGGQATVFACGPTGMLRAVAARCRAVGVATQLSWEAHMRCGIGLCGSCEIGAGWLTCLDGPVLSCDPLEQSAWDTTR